MPHRSGVKPTRLYPFKDEKHVWFLLYVHPTVKALGRFVAKRCKQCKVPPCKEPGSLGVTHLCSQRIKVDRFGQPKPDSIKGCLGSMHLVTGRITPEVVAHECTHAMMFTMGCFVNSIPFDHQMFRLFNEPTAYMVSDMVAQICKNTKIVIP